MGGAGSQSERAPKGQPPQQPPQLPTHTFRTRSTSLRSSVSRSSFFMLRTVSYTGASMGAMPWLVKTSAEKGPSKNLGVVGEGVRKWQ